MQTFWVLVKILCFFNVLKKKKKNKPQAKTPQNFHRHQMYFVKIIAHKAAHFSVRVKSLFLPILF